MHIMVCVVWGSNQNRATRSGAGSAHACVGFGMLLSALLLSRDTGSGVEAVLGEERGGAGKKGVLGFKFQVSGSVLKF